MSPENFLLRDVSGRKAVEGLVDTGASFDLVPIISPERVKVVVEYQVGDVKTGRRLRAGLQSDISFDGRWKALGRGLLRGESDDSDRQ
jgi:hypothetical protein